MCLLDSSVGLSVSLERRFVECLMLPQISECEDLEVKKQLKKTLIAFIERIGIEPILFFLTKHNQSFIRLKVQRDQATTFLRVINPDQLPARMDTRGIHWMLNRLCRI